MQIRLIDGRWCAYRDGHVVAVKDTLAAAVMAVTAAVTVDDTKLLDDVWTGPVAASEAIDFRDFTNCDWSWRDPAEAVVPLMWMGHDQADLAGFATKLWMVGTTPWATGRYFDDDIGRDFRDKVAAVGRFGVSVEPGDVDYDEVCIEEDDGFCIDFRLVFNAYQIGAIAGVPIPGFEGAYIENVAPPAETSGSTVLAFENMPPHEFVDDDDDGLCDFEADGEVCGGTEDEHTPAGEEAAARPMAASAPARPPIEWFRAPRFVELCPLTIEDDGRVYGHVAGFGECHIGYGNRCVTPPRDIALDLMRCGEVVCEGGERVPTAPIFMGTDHPALSLDALGAIDHYAHTGTAWADLSYGTDDIGIWCAGALRPGITEDQLRILRASPPSGDWRPINGKARLIAVLSVNTPGYPIPRRLVASGLPIPVETDQRFSVRMVGDALVAAVGIGRVEIVCPECERARAEQGVTAAVRRGDLARVADTMEGLTVILGDITTVLDKLEVRTRGLEEAALQAARERLTERLGGNNGDHSGNKAATATAVPRTP